MASSSPSSAPSPSPASSTQLPNEIPIPTALPLLTAPPPPSSRRLPPPCWTPDETSALLDAYRDKWYSLRRGNLRAAHWQDVADDVHRRCPSVSPPKTAVQCRHKMEKLRKRYRAELQRAKSIPHHRFSSSWVYFSKMDAMEKGPEALRVVSLSSPPVASVIAAPMDNFNDVDEESEDAEDGEYSYRDYRDFNPNGSRVNSGSGSRFRPNLNPNPNPNYGYKQKYGNINHFSSAPDSRFEEGMSIGGMNSTIKKKRRTRLGKRGREVEEQEEGGEGAMEMVEAIRMLGEGFVRMEKMKMEMMRETERMRMEMEMKRTEMILQSQHRIVESFAKGWADSIKVKKDTSHC